jgi:anti-anti-sigma regulatory factor
MEISETASTIPTSYPTSDGQRTVIALVGAIDLESTDRLDSEFADATWMGTGQVTLDMSQLQLIDAPAISAVLRGIGRLRAAGATLEIRYPSPMALQLFEMCAPLQLVGIEFTSAPNEQLSDGALNWTAREVVGVPSGEYLV